MSDDLRGFVERLRRDGEVVEVEDEVSPVHQAAALFETIGLDAGPAVYAGRVAGYPQQAVIGNLLGTRQRLGKVLGVGADALDAEFHERRRQKAVPRLVNDGPIREVVVSEHPDLLEHIPVLTYYEDDSGPYITAGAVIAREPGGSRLGMGIHRLQVKRPDRLGILLASPPLSDFLKSAEALGQPLPVSIALGAEPALTLAAVARIDPGEDKLEVAGGLLGRPVEMVPGVTVDVPAPARAEFVIEGRVLPGVREVDGPFGESTGTYLPFECPVIEVTGITRRRQPLYHAILPWGAEVDLLMDLTAGRLLLTQLQASCPCVRQLRMSMGTCGMQVVIQVRPSRPDEVCRALSLLLSLDNHVKMAIAVNEDVDPDSARDVAWAMSTRMQPDRDLFILSGMEGFIIDPTSQGGSTAKVGIDATLPPDDLYRWRRIQMPAEARTWARSVWQRRREKGWTR